MPLLRAMRKHRAGSHLHPVKVTIFYCSVHKDLLCAWAPAPELSSQPTSPDPTRVPDPLGSLCPACFLPGELPTALATSPHFLSFPDPETPSFASFKKPSNPTCSMKTFLVECHPFIHYTDIRCLLCAGLCASFGGANDNLPVLTEFPFHHEGSVNTSRKNHPLALLHGTLPNSPRPSRPLAGGSPEVHS